MISFEGEVKLIDFGIAKVQTHRQTESSAPRASFSYMSPEQTRGEPLDRRSDIFSLGVVLYELLTGERLFPSITTCPFWRRSATSRSSPLDAEPPHS